MVLSHPPHPRLPPVLGRWDGPSCCCASCPALAITKKREDQRGRRNKEASLPGRISQYLSPQSGRKHILIPQQNQKQLEPFCCAHRVFSIHARTHTQPHTHTHTHTHNRQCMCMPWGTRGTWWKAGYWIKSYMLQAWQCGMNGMLLYQHSSQRGCMQRMWDKWMHQNLTSNLMKKQLITQCSNVC